MISSSLISIYQKFPESTAKTGEKTVSQKSFALCFHRYEMRMLFLHYRFVDYLNNNLFIRSFTSVSTFMKTASVILGLLPLYSANLINTCLKKLMHRSSETFSKWASFDTFVSLPDFTSRQCKHLSENPSHLLKTSSQKDNQPIVDKGDCNAPVFHTATNQP